MLSVLVLEATDRLLKVLIEYAVSREFSFFTPTSKVAENCINSHYRAPNIQQPISQRYGKRDKSQHRVEDPEIRAEEKLVQAINCIFERIVVLFFEIFFNFGVSRILDHFNLLFPVNLMFLCDFSFHLSC